MHDANVIAGLRPQIVLVDDNDLDNEFHQILLNRLAPDLPVRVFEGGGAFLSFLRNLERPCDCRVFLDINMPGMTGFEVLERIAQEGIDLTGVRIHILSSSDNPADRTRAASHAALQGYLTKPLSAGALTGALGRDSRT